MANFSMAKSVLHIVTVCTCIELNVLNVLKGTKVSQKYVIATVFTRRNRLLSEDIAQHEHACGPSLASPCPGELLQIRR